MNAALVCVAVAAPALAPPPSAGDVARAVERSIPLLMKAAEGHAEQKTCFACHNQAFPMVGFAAARAKGFGVPDGFLKAQTDHIAEFLSTNKKNYESGKGTGGQTDTAGWALYALWKAGREPDDTTAAVAGYLLARHADKGGWITSSSRPPTEASSFATGYVAARGLKQFAGADKKEAVKKRLDAAREWTLKTPAKDTEDRVYRLRLLHLTGATGEQVNDAAKELARFQRLDGGWAQLDALASDPYATATALAALLDSGGWDADGSAFRRGVGFLVRSQQADGSWFVKSRSKPFQPYYESGFPHAKDQFISAAASGWATAVLAAASPVQKAAGAGR